MKLSVSIDGVEQARRTFKAWSTVHERALAGTAVAVEHIIEREAARHNQSGRLVRSIYKRRIVDGWEIGHDPRVAPHAVFVHWGTRPHDIRPRQKRALRWASGGAFRFAKKVRHPGTKADPWLVRAAREAPIIFSQRVAALLAQGG